MATPTERKCSVCREVFGIDNFRSKYDKSRPNARNCVCKQCDLKLSAIRAKRYRDGLKLAALSAYSPDGVPRCACTRCPEHTNPHLEFLTIDHIDAGGRAHRREADVGFGWTFYRWLKAQKYPPGYRVLCANCNLAKSDRSDFKCPHESDES